MSDDVARVQAILEANKSKDFVKRILDPDNSPSMDLGKGFTGTHLMATAESDGVHYAYPTIQRDADGNLTKLEPNEAFQQAMANDEAIAFDTAEEALWFSKRYKTVWGEQ